MSSLHRILFITGTAANGLPAAGCGSSSSHTTMPGMDHTGGAAT